MATNTLAQAERSAHRRLISGPLFEFSFLIASAWFITGTYLDSWAHNHIPVEDFFTPWHAVLYSGVLVTALVLSITLLYNWLRGASRNEIIPAGYGLACVGAYGMLAVGFGDALWHQIFGIELNIDAIFSPTHLAGMLCSNLMVTGPYRALYQRPGQLRSWYERIWLLISVVLFLTMISNDAQPTSPFVTLWPVTARTGFDTEQLLAVTSFIVQATILGGIILYTIRRWKLFPGFFLVTLAAMAIPLSFMRDHYEVILIGAISGLILDIAYFVLKPALARPLALRIFAIFATTTLFATYILTLQFKYGIVWTIHLAVGSLFVIAILGWLLSYLVLPGYVPQETAET